MCPRYPSRGTNRSNNTVIDYAGQKTLVKFDINLSCFLVNSCVNISLNSACSGQKIIMVKPRSQCRKKTDFGKLGNILYIVITSSQNMMVFVKMGKI